MQRIDLFLPASQDQPLVLGLSQEVLLEPGQPTELRIRLGATANCFQPGHRIRLEITSSDFPNHDRNHNTGGDDLAEARMVPATQTIHHTAERPSRLVLPVDEEG